VKNQSPQCLQLFDNPKDVAQCVQILQNGGLVALPSETVYGLGADATNPQAVRRVFEAKKRPTGHPLIIHVANIEDARKFSSDFNNVAEILGSTFWPGPLTLLVKRSNRVIDEITGGRETVALRVPSHTLFQKVLAYFSDVGSGAIAAPSANLYGSVSPTTSQHVSGDLGDRIDAILDGGPCGVGIESTIVDCSVTPPVVLRQGAITLKNLNDVLAAIGVVVSDQVTGDSRAPGMQISHYSPSAEVKLFENLSDLKTYEKTRIANGIQVATILGSSNREIYARELYALLRSADSLHPQEILVLLPPSTDIGVAIRDRLFKAAAPR